MKHFEVLETLRDKLNDEAAFTKEAYLTAEAQLVSSFGDYIMNADVTCTAYGEGKVTAYSGDTFDAMIIDIVFDESVKRFSLLHIMTMAGNPKAFVKFIDEESVNVWSAAWTVHTELTTTYKEYEATAKQLAIEAEKKAAAEKKAEEKYLRLKDKAIKDFEALQNRAKETITQADEFYYALGWLAKHAGTVTAALPDYLADAFAKCFGAETPCRVVDSKHRGPAGWQSQWSWSFKVTLKKAENIPAILTSYLNNTGKAIANTAFVWDLVDDYGFQFGKKQDVEKIKQTIPTQYMSMFEAGLTA